MYLSLSAYGGVTTRQALETIAAAGIHQVELAIGVKPDAEVTPAIRDFQQQGMVFRAHHAFVWDSSHRPFNLARAIDRNYFQRMIEWLAIQGIEAYSVHPGSYGRDKTAAWQQLLENLGWLQHLCEQHSIALGVETMYPGGERNFLGDLPEIMELRRLMPTLRWVLDLSHLNLWPIRKYPSYGIESCADPESLGMSDRLATLVELAPHLLEIHISDNDGRQDRHQAISDRTWWLPFQHLWPAHIPYVLETRLNRQSPMMLSHEYQRVQGYRPPSFWAVKD
jgi:sugar phosphate isomerase/epimerase